MSSSNEEFLKRLLVIFKDEAEEHLRHMVKALIELEKGLPAEDNARVIEGAFREAHSLKGAARAADMRDIESICQSLESVFHALKSDKISLSPQLFDTVHGTLDRLRELVRSAGERSIPGALHVNRVMDDLTMIANGKAPTVSPEYTQKDREKTAGNIEPVRETVRIAVDVVDDLLMQVEEMVTAKLLINQRADDVRELKDTLGMWRPAWSKAVHALRDLERMKEKRDSDGSRTAPGSHVLKLLDFADWMVGHMRSVESRLAVLEKSMERDCHSMSLMVDNLLENTKNILMLPFSTLLETFPKLVRDLSRDEGKEVDLIIHAEEVSMDRRILDRIRDVFVHLLRNAVDHGIEKPADRIGFGKPRRGTITLAVTRSENNRVEVRLQDDGSGIDLDALRETSVRRGILTEDEYDRFTHEDTLSLAFRSGVSTSGIITDVSGRGLGLAIVKEKIEELGGKVTLETHPYSGTTVTMTLPLTLATFRAVLASVAGQEFAIPTVNVTCAMRIKKSEIQTVENRETVVIDDITVPLVRLAAILELPPKDRESPFFQALVLNSLGEKIAFLVDEVGKEQEVLIKTFGYHLSRIRNVAGATILGSGKVAPVLNVSDLIRSAPKVFPVGAVPQAKTEKDTKRSVLVVEDSITSRMLLKSILETAGYTVKTAVDGIDAITLLKTEKVDIVVSDVDMPRLNGFDLTAMIRGDKALVDIPVILVTALESRADRERGVDVGANAYIIKSSFDQSNLLEVIRRII